MRHAALAFALLLSASAVAAATRAEIDAQIEAAYVERYGTPRQESQLTSGSKAVWVQNILDGTVAWAFNACGPVWSVEVLRCSLGLLPPAAPIQQSFATSQPPPPAPPVPSPPQPVSTHIFPDATPNLDAAALAACQGPSRTIRFGAGTYHFTTPPQPFPCGVQLVGEGKGATLLQRDYSGDFLQWVGGQEGGGGMEKLAVYAGPGTAGGTGISVVALAVHPIGTVAGAVVLRDVTISGAGTWDYAVHLDGSQRQNCAAACGVRIVRFDNVHLFQASLAALLCNLCVGYEWIGGGTYGIYPDVVFIGGANNYLNADIQGTVIGSVRLRP